MNFWISQKKTKVFFYRLEKTKAFDRAIVLDKFKLKKLKTWKLIRFMKLCLFKPEKRTEGLKSLFKIQR